LCVCMRGRWDVFFFFQMISLPSFPILNSWKTGKVNHISDGKDHHGHQYGQHFDSFFTWGPISPSHFDL